MIPIGKVLTIKYALSDVISIIPRSSMALVVKKRCEKALVVMYYALDGSFGPIEVD